MEIGRDLEHRSVLVIIINNNNYNNKYYIELIC